MSPPTDHVSTSTWPAVSACTLWRWSSAAISHIKPGELDTVMSEIAALDQRHRVQALTVGQVLVLT